MKIRPFGLFAVLLSTPFFLGASCGGDCPSGTERYDVKGENFVGIEVAQDGYVCLTKDPAVIGFPLLGTYQYDDFGTYGPPIVTLSQNDGESVFQRHGVTAQKMDWGILLDANGVPVGAESDHGARIFLFYKVTEPGHSECTPGLVCDPNDQVEYSDGVGEWDAVDFSVSFGEQMMYVLGERELACPQNTPCEKTGKIPPPKQ